MGIVSTIGQRCKRCYSCIRECPARAIRVLNGQAVVIEERCIACGHCVKVCSQNAKQVLDDVGIVMNELLPSYEVYAIVAPSFPASFPGVEKQFITALKKLGFKHVSEAAFGADLISDRYKSFIENNSGKTIISSPCPAIYNWITKYFVEISGNLAAVVSPMIAMGRFLKKNYGDHIKVVFIGPCIAKKSEYLDPEVDDAIDAVLTFKEIKQIFEQKEIDLNSLDASSFDPPHAYMGKAYPLTGGLLKTTDTHGDILEKEIIVVEGKDKVEEILNEIADKKIKSKFVDILFCEGCINGPAVDSELNYYSRREKVISFIESDINSFDKKVWQSALYNNRDIDLSRNFTIRNQRRPTPPEETIKSILAKSNKFSKSDELNCGACGYPTCREYAIAIAKGLAEEDMCLPYLIDKLEQANKEIRETQEQLANAEKLASIGQLAAGVAHELNNPLGSILIYASMLKKKIERIGGDKQNIEDLKLIIEETERCKNIVSNLLNFARQGRLCLDEIEIKSIIDSIFKLIKIRAEFSDINLNIDDRAGGVKIQGDRDQLKQAFMNIIINACEAMENSKNKILSVIINESDNKIKVVIRDTGCGIKPEYINKIFTPFFTTKKMGKGTGLGLAITYGIIKMHRGDITVKSKPDEGSEFEITLPIKQNYMILN
ncbi:[Fe-Fe] hydrogenase large subunit C-terminal domain-containing protein [Melioribacter sp. Ez-97]|uniref:[Fe-Fe] hydrogenase large subunit C-terminal domain-containing protein n=1 Tax=Melioribacter sp. Ez-97 TaxID=3423434 RepID=UPI003ED9CE79